MLSLLLSSVVGQLTPTIVHYAGGIPVYVNTTKGMVQGMFNRFDNVNRFYGIPYAAPASGANRFQGPQPVTPWGYSIASAKVTTATIVCAQMTFAPTIGPATWSSEDCLTIDVVAPAAAVAIANTPLQGSYGAGTFPVQFWIYGGGMTSESFPDYQQPDHFYAKGDPVNLGHLPYSGKLITCKTNYRINWLGGAAHPALLATSVTGYTGSYGLIDVIFSLKWVQTEIGGFGGDASRVTIQGESAGATVVGLVLSSPLSYSPTQLFAGAIGESMWPVAGYGATWGQTGRFEQTDMLIGATGCGPYNSLTAVTSTAGLQSIAACLRALPWQTIQSAGGAVSTWESYYGTGAWAYAANAGYQIYPCTDGYAMTDAPINMWASGTGSNVAVMIGSNADEMTYFIQSPPAVGSYAYNLNAAYFNALYAQPAAGIYANSSYAAQLALTFPSGTIENFYSQFPNEYYRQIQFNNDGQFTAGHIKMFDTFAAQSGRYKGLYRYLYAETNRGAMNMAPPLGVPHTAELNYVWGYYSVGKNYLTDNLAVTGGVFTYSANQIALGNTMKTYWANFFHTGNPNGGSVVPTWSGITTTSKNTMVFQTGVVATGAQLNPCAMLTDCYAEPTADFRRAQANFIYSGFSASSAAAATCTSPTVWNTTAVSSTCRYTAPAYVSFGSGCASKSTCSTDSDCTVGGELCYCRSSTGRRSLLFGAPSGTGSQTCVCA